MAVSDWPGKALWLFDTVREITKAAKKQGESIEKLKEDNNALKERIARLEERLESREEVVVAKAGAAASVAAQQVALASASGIYSRLAVLEAQREPPRHSPRLTGRQAKKADPD